jgi:hypothetical protein
MKRGILWSVLAAALATSSCVVAPVAYHEGVAAPAPPPGTVEGAFGYHRMFWNVDNDWVQGEYFGFHARVGQRLGPLAFEEGLSWQNNGLLGLRAGVGLRRPCITLRGMWAPLLLSPRDIGFDPDNWWQFSLLGGSPRYDAFLGWAFGGRASKLGIGPVLVGEIQPLPSLALRAELSVTGRAPWADPDDRRAVGPPLALPA